jgi:hypothetical protein
MPVTFAGKGPYVATWVSKPTELVVTCALTPPIEGGDVTVTSTALEPVTPAALVTVQVKVYVPGVRRLGRMTKTREEVPPREYASNWLAVI